MQSKSVELVPAFVWTCPECGVDKFERAILVELSEEEIEELQQEEDGEPEEAGSFLTSPQSVTCDKCKRTFATVEFYEEG